MDDKDNLFSILMTIERRFGVYLLNKNSYDDLENFIQGYFFGYNIAREYKSSYDLKYLEFRGYVIDRLIDRCGDMDSNSDYWDYLSKVSNGDNVETFELYFSLIKEFVSDSEILIYL